MAKYDKADIERRMSGAVESLKGDLAGLRTGRANTALLDPLPPDTKLVVDETDDKDAKKRNGPRMF